MIKKLTHPLHEYKFGEIEDDKNISANTKQIKIQDAVVKQPAININSEIQK